MRNVACKLKALFRFKKILCKNDSKEVNMLIWTDLDSFAITYPIASFKNFIFE